MIKSWPGRISRCSRRGRHYGFPNYEVSLAGPAAERGRSYGHFPSAEVSRNRRNPVSQPRTPAIKSSIAVLSSPLEVS